MCTLDGARRMHEGEIINDVAYRMLVNMTDDMDEAFEEATVESRLRRADGRPFSDSKAKWDPRARCGLRKSHRAAMGAPEADEEAI